MTERWTPAIDEELSRLWTAGTTNEDISTALGRTVSAVKSRAARLRLGVRDRSILGKPMSDGKLYWTADEDRRLLGMKRQGLKHA